MSDVVLVACITGASVVAAALITRSGVRVAQARVATIGEKVEQIDGRVEQIDKAVNGQGEGRPSIVERVVHRDDIAVDIAHQLVEFRDWTIDSFVRLALDRGVALSPIPTAVPPAPPPVPVDP